MLSRLFSNTIVPVPPLARREDGEISPENNRAIMAHLEQGGVTTYLIGGNALVHHWPMSKYAEWWDGLVEVAPEQSTLVPSVGPDAGKLHDQAKILATRRVPMAMLLPVAGPFNPEGLSETMRAFHAESGVPLLVYIKTDNYLPAETLGALVDEGIAVGVKYAVPRAQGAADPYLDALIAEIGASRILSGFGEPPAMAHLRDKGLLSFTTGCCCIAPALSMALFRALKSGASERSERLLTHFLALETLRGKIGEIRVLHDALSGVGIAQTGPILKPCDPVPKARREEIVSAAQVLLEAEQAFRKEGVF